MTGSDKAIELIESWKIVLKNEMKPNGKAWVLFKHGTVVLVGDAQSVETVTEEAKKLMEQDGPVIAGTQHGDFNVSKSVNVFVINHNLEQSYKQTKTNFFKHGTVVLVGDAQSVETVTEEAKKLMEH